jgi:hypothetical protein
VLGSLPHAPRVTAHMKPRRPVGHYLLRAWERRFIHSPWARSARLMTLLFDPPVALPTGRVAERAHRRHPRGVRRMCEIWRFSLRRMCENGRLCLRRVCKIGRSYLRRMCEIGRSYPRWMCGDLEVLSLADVRGLHATPPARRQCPRPRACVPVGWLAGFPPPSLVEVAPFATTIAAGAPGHPLESGPAACGMVTSAAPCSSRGGRRYAGDETLFHRTAPMADSAPPSPPWPRRTHRVPTP